MKVTRWNPVAILVGVSLLLVATTDVGRPGVDAKDPLFADVGSCNMTSEGEQYSSGYYGATTLKPISVIHGPVEGPLYCTYTFRGSPGQRVLFHLKKLRGGEYDYERRTCNYGWLKLWDGIRQPGRYPFPANMLCGDYDNGEINVRKFSSQTAAEIEFYIEKNIRRATFTLTYKYVNIELEAPSFPKQINHHMKLSSSSVCDWTIAMEDCGGFCDLMSPGYPGTYPPNMECQYHIFTHDRQSALQLTFEGLEEPKPREFDIRRTAKCKEDYIEVYDGNSSSSPLIGRFCGRKMPDITASGGHFYILFYTGPDTPPYGHNGFYASAITLTKEWHRDGSKVSGTWCDWVFNASEGSVSSPDYWIPQDTTCTYTFAVRSLMYLEVILTIYGLERSCRERIEIYESTRMVDRICESRLEAPQPRMLYNLTADPVKIKYYTARGQYQSTPDVGFWVSFRHISSPKRYSESVMLKDEMAGNGKNSKNTVKTSSSSCTHILGYSFLVNVLLTLYYMSELCMVSRGTVHIPCL